MRRCRPLCMAVLLMLMTSQGCAAPSQEARSLIPERCSDTIHDYVKKARGWKESAYVIDEEGFGGPGRGFSIWVLAEDGVIPPPGGGKSFHVELDQECSRVTEELGYQ